MENRDKSKLAIVDQLPVFPGGLYYLVSYLSENVLYPEEALTKQIQGRVIVSFVVETDGTLSNIQIEQSVSPSLDEEALRVVRNMPRWIPAKQSRNPIKLKFNLPINFSL